MSRLIPYHNSSVPGHFQYRIAHWMLYWRFFMTKISPIDFATDEINRTDFRHSSVSRPTPWAMCFLEGKVCKLDFFFVYRLQSLHNTFLNGLKSDKSQFIDLIDFSVVVFRICHRSPVESKNQINWILLFKIFRNRQCRVSRGWKTAGLQQSPDQWTAEMFKNIYLVHCWNWNDFGQYFQV